MKKAKKPSYIGKDRNSYRVRKKVDGTQVSKNFSSMKKAKLFLKTLTSAS